jgi:hypothetical protein
MVGEVRRVRSMVVLMIVTLGLSEYPQAVL